MTNKEIKDRLNKDIDIICSRLLMNLPSPPKAIFLCGGYGREEGAWYINEDGDVSPYNDYDVAIITDTPLSQERTNDIRISIAKEIGIHWIDIDYYTEKNLLALKSTIHNIDLLYGSKCIFGNASVLDICPRLDSKKIGITDVIKLYETRIWTFLGSWNGDFHDLNLEESMFFKNQMAKATLAACDLFLIPEKKYDVSYRQRANLVVQLYSDDKQLSNRVIWAINEKLHPTSDNLKKEEMEYLYFEVKDIFLRALEIAFGSKEWRYWGNPDMIQRGLKSFIRSICILFPFWGKARKNSKSWDVFLSQVYIFLANDRGQINDDYVQKASDFLIKWAYLPVGDYDWSFLHNVVAEARNNI